MLIRAAHSKVSGHRLHVGAHFEAWSRGLIYRAPPRTIPPRSDPPAGRCSRHWQDRAYSPAVFHPGAGGHSPDVDFVAFSSNRLVEPPTAARRPGSTTEMRYEQALATLPSHRDGARTISTICEAAQEIFDFGHLLRHCGNYYPSCHINGAVLPLVKLAQALSSVRA